MQATSEFVLKTITSDRSLAQLPSKDDRLCYNTVQQATMQATSKTIWKYMTSDQSLAGSHTFRTLEDNITKRTIYSKAYTNDQLENQQLTMNQNKATRLLLDGPY